jgi:hypothetical protein
MCKKIKVVENNLKEKIIIQKNNLKINLIIKNYYKNGVIYTPFFVIDKINNIVRA